MRKFFVFLFIAGLMTFTVLKSQAAITFKEAMNQNKPIVILVYADWADDVQPALQKMTDLERKYSNKYNFVTMNIANEQTKEFNKNYHIYPGLPYILLFKDNGRISRYLQKSCVLDSSCVSDKMDVFAN